MAKKTAAISSPLNKSQILADIAIKDPETFTRLADTARTALAAA